MKTTETPRWKRTEVEPREVYLEGTRPLFLEKEMKDA